MLSPAKVTAVAEVHNFKNMNLFLWKTMEVDRWVGLMILSK